MNCCSIIIRTKANYHLSSHRFIFLTKCIEHKQEIINIFSAVFSRQRETRIPIQISLLYWHHIDQRPKQPPNQQFLENRIQKEKESYSNHPFSPHHLLSNKLLPTFQLQHNQDRFTTSPPLPNTTASESNPFPVDFPWTPPLTSATTQSVSLAFVELWPSQQSLLQLASQQTSLSISTRRIRVLY